MSRIFGQWHKHYTGIYRQRLQRLTAYETTFRNGRRAPRKTRADIQKWSLSSQANHGTLQHLSSTSLAIQSDLQELNSTVSTVQSNVQKLNLTSQSLQRQTVSRRKSFFFDAHNEAERRKWSNQKRRFCINVVTMETSAIGWPPWLFAFWYLWISEQLYMLLDYIFYNSFRSWGIKM